MTEIRAAYRSSTHKLHLGPVDGKGPYVYVPFTVPEGTEEVVVELNYDRGSGDNAIDFAIFDARFSGRRDDLTGYRGKNPNRPPLISRVGREIASDGHIPGPMPAGIWRVMFYVYKTAAQGVDVSLTISIASAGETPRAIIPGVLEHWLRGDLHTHTLHSDGLWTVTSAAAAAAQTGLDFLAITDHNTTSHHADIDRMPSTQVLLIKGIEITTAGGHMNIWGVPDGLIFEHRQLVGENAAVRQLTDEAHAAGARISINHPFAGCKACEWRFDDSTAGFDSIEVWNGSWDSEDEAALKWWDKLLRSGRHITAIGSSDSHGQQNSIGVPATFVKDQSRHEASSGRDQSRARRGDTLTHSTNAARGS